jgi:hypothetical protein
MDALFGGGGGSSDSDDGSFGGAHETTVCVGGAQSLSVVGSLGDVVKP